MEMSTSLARAIQAIKSRPGGWLHVETIRKTRTRVLLSLALREGKGGRWISGWDVSCTGVREINVSDFDGGGIRLYRSAHPAARQYTTRMAQLRCQPAGRWGAILGALAAAHVATVDDWIPLDRYLPMKRADKAGFVVRAPDFLVRAYARALGGLGVVVRVTTVGPRRRPSPAPRVLHLGNSFVVADGFEAIQRLEKSQKQRTAPVQASSRRG
jgi:hypothetical protein